MSSCSFFDNSLKKLAGNAWAKFAALGSAVGTDVLIAASMCLMLAIRRTSFSRQAVAFVRNLWKVSDVPKGPTRWYGD
ncbi:hypothetical protein PHLCEN_2v6856 [Hermanssonia centrifuga]|uniref:Uncharacterized protein n=1 Tax=Hermanssonia centrifuga TaxID=98765 RepID=A0A2R6NY78_9APHY|nr:hypothetical protein PHLCEN_2v6856 [Hermanssonia centrifuga]